MVQQVEGLDPLGRFVGRREMGAVERALGEGETLLQAVDCIVSGRPAVLAWTDRRLLQVTRTLLRTRVAAWEHDEVVLLRAERGRDDAELAIQAGEVSFTARGVRKEAAEAFAATARPYVADREFRLARVAPDGRAVDPLEGSGIHERLRRLERMRTMRSITEAEYKVNRRRILEAAGLPTDLLLRRGRKA